MDFIKVISTKKERLLYSLKHLSFREACETGCVKL